jgi:hypothetical protein
VEDRVLSLQRAFDRFIRLLRRGAAPPVTARRLLIVQIDGLSRAVLRMGLGSGRMPFLRQLLNREGYQLEPMIVGLPTSTPAFQMATMYGVPPDIPGFHYYDRERRGDIHFPRAGHAAWVEAKHSPGRRGILEGGSAYGCIFTGGADNSFYTLASLTRPSGRGLLAALSPFVVISWVCLKSALRTIVELAKALPRLAARPVSRRQGWRWLTIKIGMGIWVRGFFTMAVARDLYAGTPAIYVNYVDYDEASHAFGPRSRAALITLRRIDAALRELWQVARRVPEHRYDLYILADHGQVPCKSYPELNGGQRFEVRIFDELLNQFAAGAPAEDHSRSGVIDGMRQGRRGAKGLFQHFLNYLNEDYIRRGDPEAHEQGGLRVISAGPNAFLYVLDAREPLDVDALARRFPGLAERLSESPGVGFVLARSSDGPVCFWRGMRYTFRQAGPELFAKRADAALILQGVEALMKMPSAGDLVIYGIATPQGHVSFLPEWGAHAGPSRDEMNTFLVHSSRVPVPTPIHHPMQLYEHFIRYLAGTAGPGGARIGPSDRRSGATPARG